MTAAEIRGLLRRLGAVARAVSPAADFVIGRERNRCRCAPVGGRLKRFPQRVAVLCGREELDNSTSSYLFDQMLAATGSSDPYARCHAVLNRSA